MALFFEFLEDAVGADDGHRGRRPRHPPGRSRRAFRRRRASACSRAARRFILQNADGQIDLTHSVSAGLDYAAVGPEHAYLPRPRPHQLRLRDRRRGAGGVPAVLAHRGDHSGAGVHPRAGARAQARPGASGRPVIIVSLSGRGDKDVQQVEALLRKSGVASSPSTKARSHCWVCRVYLVLATCYPVLGLSRRSGLVESQEIWKTDL